MIKDKRILRKLDVVFGVVMLVASIVMLCLSAAMPVAGMGGAMTSSFWIAPGALPVVVSSVLILLSLILIWGGVKAGAKITPEDIQGVKRLLRTPAARYIYLVSAALIIYICLMLGNMPYWVATFSYLVLFMLALKAAKFHVIVIASALTTLGVWYCFGQVAMILLP